MSYVDFSPGLKIRVLAVQFYRWPHQIFYSPKYLHASCPAENRWAVPYCAMTFHVARMNH